MAKQFICGECGSIGKSKTGMSGSLVVEIFLWLMMLLPGLLYSLWRLTTKAKVCRSCGSRGIVPIESPRGRILARQFGSAVAK